ncbi:MAG: hypothetical protein HWE26_14555 [Alteromonadaceae bacterium]|nr:hypothetical protein [Alteromonadaceae bacterium]
MSKYKQLPLIIGITGQIRAGKSTAATYLESHFGYKSIPNAQVLQKILSALGLPLKRELLAATGDALFAELGRGIIARARVAEVQSTNSFDTSTRYVIDGIRYLEELDVYRTLPSFKLIALEATDKERYQRTLDSDNTTKDGNISLDNFMSLNLAQSERYVPQLINAADFNIKNSGDMRQLEHNINSALKSFTEQ